MSITPRGLQRCRRGKLSVQTIAEFILFPVESPNQENRSVYAMDHVQFVFSTEFQESVHVEMNRIKNKSVNIFSEFVVTDIDSSPPQRFAQSQHELIASAIWWLKKGMPQPYGEPVRSGPRPSSGPVCVL